MRVARSESDLLLATLLVFEVQMKLVLQNSSFEINISYRTAYTHLPEKFDIRLLQMFVDQEAGENLLKELLLDDEKCLGLLWYFVEPQCEGKSFDDFLDIIQSGDLDKFRQVFWEEVANFSGPLKRNLVMQLWEMLQRELKEIDLQSETSTVSSSNSSSESA